MDQAEPHPAVEPPKRPDKPQLQGKPQLPDRPELPDRAQRPDKPEVRDPGQDRRGQDQGLGLDHPILAGFDGSPASRNALAYAAGLARRLERPLLVVYVTGRRIYCEPLTGQVIGAVSDGEEICRWLRAELDEVCDAEGLQLRTITRCGSPAKELAAAAAECSADALVIGASSQARHQLAGSVPGWLARHVQCPLIVVP